MAGEKLERARLSEHGIAGDRIYAFVQEHPPNERFPWMTAREASEMLLFKPRFVGSSKIEVDSPGGRVFQINDEELLDYFQTKYSKSLVLRFDESGCKDSKPVSLIGLSTINSIGREVAMDVAPERFRANLYAEWNSGEPFYEDKLVGKVLQIGDAEIKIAKKDSRCVIPTLDPSNASAAPQVLEAIKKNHGGCAGVYAFVQKPGEIGNGDAIRLVA